MKSKWLGQGWGSLPGNFLAGVEWERFRSLDLALEWVLDLPVVDPGSIPGILYIGSPKCQEE